MASLDMFLDSLLFLIPLLHLLAAPHTKVEESFNLQATHDILVYGTPTSAPSARLSATYDHFAFPGAVPRTFLGAVLLAGLGQPLVWLAGFQHAQLVVRAVLGTFNAGCLLVFRNALAEACGNGAARWWVALMVSQFHVAYYVSRTLPNMFAFGLTTLALAFLLPKTDARRASVRRRQALGLLVLATAIFRSELAILLAVVGLHLLVTKQMTLGNLIPLFLGTFIAALAMSVPVDSYFWQKPVWPELWGFYYNAVLGSSSNWGVSPWHYYFTSALPRLFLNPLAIPLVVFALLQPGTSLRARSMVVPSLLYIAIYSLQPHKETRFIFYAIPPLTGAAALGASFISTRRSKSVHYGLATLVLVLSILTTFVCGMAMLLLSSLNYPGGDALSQLYAIARTDSSSPTTVTVHADVLTCMTGLTLFGQNHAGLPLALQGQPLPTTDLAATPVFLFDKTEERPELKWPNFWMKMDYALMEDPTLALGNWKTVGVVHGYDGIEVLKPGADEAGPEGNRQGYRVLGLGASVARARNTVRRLTGGWWVGPRMVPRIHIMKRVKDVQYATA
ncbi:Dol-P-Man:Man(7)GlcNAc(2)-PP-Dol alpha-1,6-mannosyltransferase [Tolypocladium capitatum]|uniref:Mannosyltransferase n=1 Tax=Tolypocladium capitatum TaxID=45235 RepID=A0A2K3QP66_9HYPO|nr:Dol-P-Man:Man(7)GlcNAc(2)-PP-Dol alpha-1,6-mannosyltransferase [Tolypocladium capitatum]